MDPKEKEVAEALEISRNQDQYDTLTRVKALRTLNAEVEKGICDVNADPEYIGMISRALEAIRF